MSHELSVTQSAALSELLMDRGTEVVLRPLVKEIHLFDTFISGTAKTNADLLAPLKPGEILLLGLETNRYSEAEVTIMNTDRVKLGRIPEKDTPIFARLMDAGKRLIARVSGVSCSGGFTEIAIGIYLADF